MDKMVQVGKKITNAARVLTKKSEDAVEIAKLNLVVGNEENRIKRLVYEMGCVLYEDYIKNQVDKEHYTEKYEEIRRHEEKIKALKEEILLHKGMRCCKNCSFVAALSMNYCPECGTKFEKEYMHGSDSSGAR